MKLYFQNVSQVFQKLIISSFINNVPIAACVLHQTPRHSFLLKYLFGLLDNYGMQLLGSLRYCIHSNHITYSAYSVVIFIIVMVPQTMLRSFIKSLENLTRRRVSHQAGLIRKVLRHHALSFLQKIEGGWGFCATVSAMISWFVD